MENSTCCEMMQYHSTFKCEQHSDKYECPDTLIDYNEDSNYFTIMIHDGGTSGIEIKYCPWCGTQLTTADENK